MSTLVHNKKAGLNYELLERYEAGASLLGTEVKSLRSKQGKLDGAHVVIRGGEAFLVGASIPAFQKANAPEDYEPERTRKLLLSQKELTKLHKESEHQGLTIVPISWYNSGQNIKLEIALARGKKNYDKREALKARDQKRDLERTLKYF
ncbi:MAG: SsrA-binding protein SmpB [Bacteroidota bacterium]